MRLEPASRYTDAKLATIFSAGYEDYFAPVTVDEAAFRAMAELYDDDLDVSQVALLDDEPVGICKVAVRGSAAWVGGLGVAVLHRQNGIAAVLMRRVIEELRARGVRELWLEVLAENVPALHLYERLGFEHTRELEVWSLDDLPADRHELSPLALDDALGRESRPPWQRADATVRNAGGARAHGHDRGPLVYRVNGATASLLQCAAECADAASALVRALPAYVTAARWLNGPDGHPLNEALARLGGTLAHRQHEMVLRL